MARWKVPSENIVYADLDGNIGEHSTGLAPLRKNWTGLLPVPEDGGYEWAGFVPNADLPHTYNPSSGFIASANHKMIPENYKYAVGFQWASPERFRRIWEVLAAAKQNGRKLSVVDMENLQNDVVSLPARDLQALLSRAAHVATSAPAKRILDWDCTLTADSSAAMLYEFWVGELRDSVSKLVIPTAAQKAVGVLSLPRLVAELSHPRAAGFGADPVAARDALLLQTLEAAEKKCVTKLGSDSKDWAWGTSHQIIFNHPLDATDAAAKLFDLGPMPRPGDGYTVNATAFVGSSFRQRAGASYREIFDLSDWDRAVGINVPGQSGQPGSPHYDDLLPLWLRGEYFPLRYSKPAIDRDTTDVLQLLP